MLSPNGNQVGATLSQALHEGGKAGSSSSVAASASNSIYQPTRGPEVAVVTGATSESHNFRSSIRPPNAPPEAFEGMTIDQFLQSEPDSQGHPGEHDQNLGKGKKPIYITHTEDVLNDGYDPNFVSAWQSGHVDMESRGQGAHPLNDGAEVVKLLSDPRFQPELWTEDDLDEPYTITKEEMQISQWFTQKAQEGGSQLEQLQRAVAAARSGGAFHDFASIFDEIENYHEDVWGYIGPLVKAARQEQHVAATTPAEDGPAVHRLRMIVAHLRSPALTIPTKPLSRS
jgi:hypothetical protein